MAVVAHLQVGDVARGTHANDADRRSKPKSTLVVFLDEPHHLIIKERSLGVVALEVGCRGFEAVEAAAVAGRPEISLTVAVHHGNGLPADGLRAEGVEHLVVGFLAVQATSVRRCPQPAVGRLLHADEGRHRTDAGIAVEVVGGTGVARQTPRRKHIDFASACAEDAVHLIA